MTLEYSEGFEKTNWQPENEEKFVNDNSDNTEAAKLSDEDFIKKEVAKNVERMRNSEPDVVRNFALGFKAGDKVVWHGRIATVAEMLRNHVLPGTVPVEWKEESGDEVFIQRANAPAEDLMRAEK